MISPAVVAVYGFIIVLYLIILKLLLNALQQLTDKDSEKRSIVDMQIHRTTQAQIEESMHTFDISAAAMVIAKAAFVVVALAAVIVIVVVKVGYVPALLLAGIVGGSLWLVRTWMKGQDRTHDIRGDIRNIMKKAASIGMVIVLGVMLLVLLLIMALLQ